jgi:hypothetical protein
MASYTLFGDTAPSQVDGADSASVTLGFAFRVSADSVTLAGIRFYKASANTGQHTAGLWRKDGGSWTLLSSLTFTDETASGWQRQNLSSPVALVQGELYAVGVFMPNGHYSVNPSSFPLTAGPVVIEVPASDSIGNGRFVYGGSLAVPLNTFGTGTGYAIDIIYDDGELGMVFDPGAKQIILETDSVSATTLWSRWVDWFLTGSNSQWDPAFRQVGGDDLGSGLLIPPYFFLLNGWRIRPREANHNLTITGNLFVDGGGVPVGPTLGVYQVNVNYTVPVQAQGINISGGGACPSASEIATAVWANAIREMSVSGNSAAAAAVLAAAVVTPIHANVVQGGGGDIPTAEENAAAVLAAAVLAPIHANTVAGVPDVPTAQENAAAVLAAAQADPIDSNVVSGVNIPAVPTAADNAAAVLAAAIAAPIHANTVAGVPTVPTAEQNAAAVLSAASATPIAAEIVAGIPAVPTADENAAAVWTAPVATNATPGSFGHFVQKKLMKIRDFLGLS